MNKLDIDYNVFSKYRGELMGIAMLNVLVLHSLGWTGFLHPTWLYLSLNIFGHLIFTEGFLFLSGFGLYYSFYRNSNIKAFYFKRIQRLLIPYWVMVIPFFLVWWLMERYSFGGLLLRLSTLEFWVHGNDGFNGMWYVSVSVVFYVLFPLIFKTINKQGGAVLLLFLTVAIIAAIWNFLPDYYHMTSIGIVKLPFFILGTWAGKQSLEKKRFSIVWLFIVAGIWYLSIRHPMVCWLGLEEGLFRIMGIIVCALFLSWTAFFKLPHSLLRWFGKYSLEIYILHLMIKGAIWDFMANGYVTSTIAVFGAILLCMPVHKICDFLTQKSIIKKNYTS